MTREVNFPTFRSTAHVAYAEGAYWTPGGNATLPTPRWGTTVDPAATGTRYWYDGAYLRLKNVEVSYTFKNNWLKKIGVNSCRLYLNGDNLYMWTCRMTVKPTTVQALRTVPTQRYVALILVSI